MRGTYMVDRPGAATLDEETGDTVCPATRVYSGRGYARYPGLAFERTPEAGAQVIVLARMVVRLPHGIVYLPGDVVTCSADPDNPGMVGKVLRVGSVDDQSQATAQRLLCDDYQGPRLVALDESES
jgi:hypothetical protein